MVGRLSHRMVGRLSHRMVGGLSHRMVGGLSHRMVGGLSHRMVGGRLWRLPVLFLMLWGGSAAAQEAPATGPYCPVVFQIPDKPVVDVELEEGDTYVNADRIDLLEKGVSELEGSVEMTTDTWSARADEAVYNDAGNFVDLYGDVKFWEESVFLDGKRAHIDLDDSTATVNAARYYIPENDAWGEAEELFIDPGFTTSGKEMAFTTCAPANSGGIEANFWSISARELNLNHETHRGSGRDIVLKIKDIPVFYAPYFTFPLEQRSKIRLSCAGYR